MTSAMTQWLNRIAVDPLPFRSRLSCDPPCEDQHFLLPVAGRKGQIRQFFGLLTFGLSGSARLGHFHSVRSQRVVAEVIQQDE
jgi:hypothetical protein